MLIGIVLGVMLALAHAVSRRRAQRVADREQMSARL
jgi:hypothetical protein